MSIWGRILTILPLLVLDLGSVDDNLSLPIISGACLLGFFKFLGFFSLSS